VIAAAKVFRNFEESKYLLNIFDLPYNSKDQPNAEIQEIAQMSKMKSVLVMLMVVATVIVGNVSIEQTTEAANR
jgi:hypothetical protein